MSQTGSYPGPQASQRKTATSVSSVEARPVLRTSSQRHDQRREETCFPSYDTAARPGGAQEQSSSASTPTAIHYPIHPSDKRSTNTSDVDDRRYAPPSAALSSLNLGFERQSPRNRQSSAQAPSAQSPPTSDLPSASRHAGSGPSYVSECQSMPNAGPHNARQAQNLPLAPVFDRDPGNTRNLHSPRVPYTFRAGGTIFPTPTVIRDRHGSQTGPDKTQPSSAYRHPESEALVTWREQVALRAVNGSVSQRRKTKQPPLFDKLKDTVLETIENAPTETREVKDWNDTEKQLFCSWIKLMERLIGNWTGEHRTSLIDTRSTNAHRTHAAAMMDVLVLNLRAYMDWWEWDRELMRNGNAPKWLTLRNDAYDDDWVMIRPGGAPTPN